MSPNPHAPTAEELFSAEEIASAARVSPAAVREVIDRGKTVAFRGYLAPAEAVALVRQLATGASLDSMERVPITVATDGERRAALPLIASGLVHAAFFALLVIAAMAGLLAPAERPVLPSPIEPARLVYLVSPGPGGGGGGGGLSMPTPPPAAKLATPAPKPKRTPSPVIRARVPPPRRPPPPRPSPPVRTVATPPRPIEPPRPTPAPAAIVAPVVTAPADPVDARGPMSSTVTSDSAGPGRLGGAGSGAGTGLGEGLESGIGRGSGGGTGGGPFRPGSGIEPPALLREVRPSYTDEARRRTIEGDVDLEIVVEADGRVGNVRVVRGLGSGLNERAIAAVRQWRFSPAKRRGTPVAVVVNVSVGFTLR